MSKVKVKDGENLSPANVEKVISLLEQEKPITKKSACEILNISYNPARLKKIIDEHKDKQIYDSRRRKEVRKQPITKSDIKYIIESYLSGDSLSLISESTFRSFNVVKNVLNTHGIPLRTSEHDYLNPPLIDEDFVSLDYKRGDLVYAARYGCPAYVEKSYDDVIWDKVFRIRLIGPNRQQAMQPFHELIDMRRLQNDFGVVLKEMSDEEIKMQINQTILEARKKNKK